MVRTDNTMSLLHINNMRVLQYHKFINIFYGTYNMAAAACLGPFDRNSRCCGWRVRKQQQQ